MIVASPRGKTKGPASRVPPGGGPKLSLTERVYAALKKDIITGELMPGQAFTENDLAHRYTASRTPVREAAVRLQAEELVRIVANRGYFVTQLTIPPQALSELERTACFRADDGKFAAFIAADTAFHLGIARLTHTPCWQERYRKCAHKLSALCSRPRTRSTCGFMESSPRGNTWPFCELFCVRIPNSPAGSCASTSSGARGNRNSAICFSRDMLDCQRLRFFRAAEGRPR